MASRSIRSNLAQKAKSSLRAGIEPGTFRVVVVTLNHSAKFFWARGPDIGGREGGSEGRHYGFTIP